LIPDTSFLIADERGQFDLPGFLRQTGSGQPAIAAITRETAEDIATKERIVRNAKAGQAVLGRDSPSPNG
jgi:hypothetical protein